MGQWPSKRGKQDGIIPAWEDEANKAGGKWSIQLPKEKNRGNVDKMWLYTVSQGLVSCDVVLTICETDAGRHWGNIRPVFNES